MAAVALVGATTVTAPRAAGQDGGASSTTAAPPTSTTPAAERAALEARVDALENQLDELNGTIPQQEAIVEASTATLAGIDDELTANQAELDATAEARVAPAAARAELVLTLYIEGDPQTRTFSEFVRKGELTSDSLRQDRLFAAAEEGTRRRVAELDAKTEALTVARQEIASRRDQAAAALEAATAELAAARAKREETVAALDTARSELKALLALSQRSPLTGAADYPLRPAIGIKIDNSYDARPQTGLTKADVVYDIIVEGGITRYLAMFQSQDAARIGPVRSARTSDISIMAGYNRPIFAYSGGNDGVLAAVRVSPMVSMTEASTPRAFVRDEGRIAPFNLYTSTAALYGQGGDAGIPNPQFVFRAVGAPSALGRPVSTVTINIGFETVSYRWNGRSWDRFTGGEPTEDTTAGQVSPQNVIVQFTNYATSPADAESPDALTVGQGEAWVLTDGKLIEARWARGIATSPVQYLDATNTQIPLTPGQTWVELPRPGSASVS